MPITKLPDGTAACMRCGRRARQGRAGQGRANGHRDAACACLQQKAAGAWWTWRDRPTVHIVAAALHPQRPAALEPCCAPGHPLRAPPPPRNAPDESLAVRIVLEARRCDGACARVPCQALTPAVETPVQQALARRP
ncbi:hypothetical protein SVAN01_07298 [Stagonosporopsis vannaccii]|nr:hypothetical protein SVAN01_07298 [Stagonosporopsis vannaccii]